MRLCALPESSGFASAQVQPSVPPVLNVPGVQVRWHETLCPGWRTSQANAPALRGGDCKKKELDFLCLFVRSNNRKEPPEKPRACMKEREMRKSCFFFTVDSNPDRYPYGRSGRYHPDRYHPRRIAFRRGYARRPSLDALHNQARGNRGGFNLNCTSFAIVFLALTTKVV